METLSSQSMFSQDVFPCQEIDKIVTKMCIIIHIGSSKEFLLFSHVEKTMIMVSAVLFSRKPFFLMIRLNKMRWRRQFFWKTLL